MVWPFNAEHYERDPVNPPLRGWACSNWQNCAGALSRAASASEHRSSPLDPAAGADLDEVHLVGGGVM